MWFSSYTVAADRVLNCCTKPLNLHTDLVGHVNVQIYLLIILKYQPVSLQFSRLSVEQPIRFSIRISI